MRTHDEMVVEVLSEDDELMDIYLSDALNENVDTQILMIIHALRAVNKRCKCFSGAKE